MKQFSRMPACGFLVIALVFSSLAVAQTTDAQAPDEMTSRDNVSITVRFGALEGSQRTPVKSYVVVVASGTVGSKMLSGQRVPIPMTHEPGEGGAKNLVYQNIGFVTNVRAWILDDNKIRIVADIEDSRIIEGEPGDPPIVETRQLTINATLTDGVPLELARNEGVNDKSGYVEIEASILR